MNANRQIVALSISKVKYNYKHLTFDDIMLNDDDGQTA